MVGRVNKESHGEVTHHFLKVRIECLVDEGKVIFPEPLSDGYELGELFQEVIGWWID